jgi:hypothetical protein
MVVRPPRCRTEPNHRTSSRDTKPQYARQWITTASAGEARAPHACVHIGCLHSPPQNRFCDIVPTVISHMSNCKRWRFVLVAAAVGLLCVPLISAKALATPPAPMIGIVNPTGGSTVEGTVLIEAVAQAGAGDYPERVEFYDGVNSIGSVDCEKQESCTASIKWAATGLTGQHTLTAQVYTADELSSTSAPVAINVVSPSPSVSVTSPTAGSIVKGDVTVAVSGETAPSQNEYPTELYVYDGVNQVGSVRCQGQRTCTGTVTWHATGLSGAHTLTARIETSRELSTTSSGVAVNVVTPPPSVRITGPAATSRLGGTLIVTVVGDTDPALMEYPTYIHVYDGGSEIGEIRCQGQQTCSGSLQWNTHGLRGPQSLFARIYTSREVSATSRHLVIGVPPRRHLKSVNATCHLATSHLLDHRPDHGLCVVTGAPVGTSAAIQYQNHIGKWVTVVRGHIADGGRFKFVLHGAGRARFALTLLVEASSASAAHRSAIGTLRVT